MATHTQSNQDTRKTTIIFGYSLFAAAIATLIIGTILPWTTLIFNPTTIKLNVLTTLFVFITAAIVPFLAAYIIGDKSTRVKNKTTHHYNGVLFGVLTYWISLFFSSIGSLTLNPIREAIPQYWISTIVGSWPILATVLTVAIIAIAYHAHPQRTAGSVLQYRPYQLVLLVSLIAPFALTLPQISSSYLLYTIINITVPFLFVGISYLVLKRAQVSRRARLAHAIVAVTFGILALQFTAQLTSLFQYNTLISYVMTAAGAAVWVLYLWLCVRKKSR